MEKNKHLGRYITREVKPVIGPNIGYLGAFTANDVLFDWTVFTLPQGGSRLVGVTAIIRANGAHATDPVDQECPMDLFFAKAAYNMGDIADGTAPTTLGTQHAASTADPANAYYNNIIGHTKLTVDNFNTDDTPSTTGVTIGTTGYHASTSGATQGLTGQSPTIFDDYGLTPGDGLHKFYVGATCIGTPNFDSNCAFVSEDETGNDLTVDGGTAKDMFAPGDRIKAYDISEDNGTIIDIGTIGTVPDDTSILLKDEASSAGTLANGDLIFNINPIKLILTFER